VEENLIFGGYVSKHLQQYYVIRLLSVQAVRSVESCCCAWRYISQLHTAGNVGFLSESCV